MSDPSGNSYRWGLVGPGRFAREFVAELSEVSRARLTAVASRDGERARSFAEEFGFEKVHVGYDELFSDPDVDIVYIVVPHVYHRELAERALAAGKAVVCEKPLTPSSSETRALVDFARERRVFLMEAMKTGFLPAVRKANDWIREGRVGEVRLVRADLCFRGPDDPRDRLMNPDLAGGAVLDVGIYPLFLARLLLGEVKSIDAAGTIAETGVEDSVAMLTRHRGGGVAALTCSFRTEEAMDAVVRGTAGEIRIPRFHAATRAELWKDGELADVCEDASGGMVRAEIEAAMDALDHGQIECPGHDHRTSVRLAELMDEVREKVGVTGRGKGKGSGGASR